MVLQAEELTSQNKKQSVRGTIADQSRAHSTNQRRRARTSQGCVPELADRLVSVKRVSKTVKGGKRFSFAALVVVGDQKGRVGYGKGKAKEVPDAIRKATEQAKRQMIQVRLREGRTLHHETNGRHGAGKVVMRAAPEGTGIIAGGPMRAVFEMLGVKDVVSKSLGSQNPYNMIRATIDGLRKEESPRDVAARRGKKVSEILPSRRSPQNSQNDTSTDTKRTKPPLKVRATATETSPVSPNSSKNQAISGRYNRPVKRSSSSPAEATVGEGLGKGKAMSVDDATKILASVETLETQPDFDRILGELIELDTDGLRANPFLRSEVLRMPDAVWRALLRNLDDPRAAEAAAKCLVAVTRPDEYRFVRQLSEARAVKDFEEILLETGNDAFVSMRFRRAKVPGKFCVEVILRKRAPFTINGKEPSLPNTGRLDENTVVTISSGLVAIEEIESSDVKDHLSEDLVFRKLRGTFTKPEGEKNVWIQVFAGSSLIASRRLWVES